MSRCRKLSHYVTNGQTRRLFSYCAPLLLLLIAFPLLPAWSQILQPGDTSQPLDQHPSEIHVDFYMTPEEAAHLLAAVDQVIDFDSNVTGLPIRGHVERQLTGRSRLKLKVEKRLQEDASAKRVQRSSLVLKKFGFIPHDFDLSRFAAESLAAEVAGYYEARTKTIYLMDWLPTRAQLPIVAHELTHALQDQNFGLEKWLEFDADNNLSEAEIDDQKTARRAVTEGQAQAVMVDYMLAPFGKTLQQLPPLGLAAVQKTAPQPNSLGWQTAPLFLREAAGFPYSYGFEFIHELLIKGGKQRAFSGVYKNPPRSTRQIMEPNTYLSGEKLPRLKVPVIEPVLGSQYEKLEIGAMGEFEAMVFVKQFGSPDQVKRIPPQWRGGYYYAAHRVSKPGEDDTKLAKGGGRGDIPSKTEETALLYVSRWATPAIAREFADLYRSSLSNRYPGALSQPGAERPLTPEEVGRWNTAEGLVILQIKGDLVMALESFDETTASRLSSLVLKEDAPD